MKRNPEAGFISFDVLGGLLVLFLLTPLIFSEIHEGIVTQQKNLVASQFNDVCDAARLFAQQNAPALLEGQPPFSPATPTTGAEITFDMLRDVGLLLNAAPENAWNQAYRMVVRQPKPGVLRVIVMTEGGREHASRKPAFGTQIVPSTAVIAGGHAGFVPVGADKLGQNSGQAVGAHDGWRLTFADVGIVPPTPGHLVGLTDLSASDMISDTLYRVEVPGKPELNEMWTSLDMTDHSIENVNDLSFVGKDITTTLCTPDDDGRLLFDPDNGLYLCRGGETELISDTGNSGVLKQALLVSHGQMVAKPMCPAGTNTSPQIFVTPSIVSAGGTAPPLTAVQGWAVNHSDTEWQIQLRVLSADKKLGWIYPGANYGKAVALTMCITE